MQNISSFKDFAGSLLDFIRGKAETQTESRFNELALALFALQFSAVAPYRRFCKARGVSPQTIGHWSEVPALPTSAFKELEISSLKPDERTQVFHSSGTTEQIPSRHFHNADSLAVYEASLLPWFHKCFLADAVNEAGSAGFQPALCATMEVSRLQVGAPPEINEPDTRITGLRHEIIEPIDKPGMIFLTPSPTLAPHSSLMHMFETVRRELASRDSLFTGKLDEQKAWSLDIDQTLFALRKSMCANRPLAILGTAFSFVHLLDHFAAHNIQYRLADGSRVLETGGYKGRSRSLPKAELHQLITKHLGIPGSHIVCEYGMSELSSQAYDSSVQSLKFEVQSPRVFRFPPWARVQIISPETGKEVGDGETGLIRIFDLANVYSVLAIQTEDLGIRRGTGFELVGRSPKVEPRGCSLMAN